MTRKLKRRVFDRQPLSPDVVLLDERGDGWLLLAADNISSNGIALRTTLPLPRGMQLRLRVSVGKTLDMHGEVLRWIKDANGNLVGIGVRFLNMKTDALLAIEQYLHSHP